MPDGLTRIKALRARGAHTRRMYQRILVPVDGTDLSRRAIATAVELARRCGAQVVGLHVVPRYPVSYFEGGDNVDPDEVARIEKQWADQGQVLADEVRTAAAAAGVPAVALTQRSDLVGETIVACVGKHACDLVVMASHGRRGLQRLLLGSETQHVLTHSTVPVLVVR